jgi:hypothetical protein
VRKELNMPFTTQIAFDTATLAILQQVYDEACQEAGIVTAPNQPPWVSEARARLAASIMDLATAGELDPLVLKKRALAMPLLIK